MSWRPAEARDGDRLIAFLRSREPGAVVFSEHVITRGVGRKASRYQKVLLFEEAGTITEAVLQTGAGFFAPTSSDGRLRQLPELRTLVAPEDSRVHSAMGELKDVHEFTDALALPLSQSVDYHLMYRSGETGLPFVEAPLPDLEYRWASSRDAKPLREIQEAYEREEVLLPGHIFDPRVSLENLKYHLKTQLVIYATHRSRVIAKAATNARGFGCDQLGGVYTRPEYRRRGVGRWLVAILVRRLRKENKGASLFVKPHNVAAVELYRSLGFSIVGPFRISYY